MQPWNEQSEQVSKITPDKERAKSLLTLIALREKDLQDKKDEFATLIVEGYYEIVKELITAIMTVDGYKTLSHEMLIGYLEKFYREFSTAELYLADQLRKTRNEIAYRGLIITSDYLNRNKERIIKLITKLKKTIEKRMQEK